MSSTLQAILGTCAVIDSFLLFTIAGNLGLLAKLKRLEKR